MRVSVIGTGYLGAVHATGMAALGHDVIGVDSDAQKIGMLQRGQSPFFEPGFPELLEQMVDSGSLRFSTDIQDAAQFAEVHFICVGTPQLPDSNNADLTQIELVVDLLLKDISPTAIIVGKSTVPVGTAASLRKRIVDRLPFGPALAWNPEFLREGFAVADTLTPDRIVFGVTDDRCEAVLRTLYAPILERGTPCIVTDLASAELVKVSANSFLATKISFINAVAEVCEAAGADVTTVARAIGLDERIGSRFLNAGIGFGGGCLGKDIRAFGAQADLLGVPSVRDLLKEIDAINNTARQRMVGLAIELLGGTVAGRRITILGAAFKPNSDDIRDSPALDIAGRLHDLGAVVNIHDPQALTNARQAAPSLSFVEDIDNAFERADIVLLLTEWDDYRRVDPKWAADQVDSPILIDGRNGLDLDAWAEEGWTCHALGRPMRPARREISQVTNGTIV